MGFTPGRVTVGIPTLNRSRLLRRAMHSVLQQTYDDVELLVSDDASTDDTMEQVRAIGDPRLVVFERKERLGLVGNFDFCLRNATGEFFLLLGDDDALEPNAIERLVEPFLTSDGDSIGISWCPCRIVDANGVQLWRTEPGPERESPASMVVALWAGQRGPRLSSILLRTEEAIQMGGFQQHHGDLCDMGLWAAVALLHTCVACVSEPLVQYTNHHGSTTSQSAVSQWQKWAHVVHHDLLQVARKCNNRTAEKSLSAAKRNFLSGITLTILIQTIGKSGWIRNGFTEAFRTPSLFLTPYVFKRLLKDGWKIVTLNRGQAGKISASIS
jgi:glycosyltransferase involved in cell wall biosynthesis